MQSDLSIADAQSQPRGQLFPKWTKWRVLFLMLLIFIVWVGYTLWSMQSRREREKEAAAFIKSLGGKAVSTVPSWLPNPLFDRKPEPFQRVTRVYLQDTSIDDAGLTKIEDLTGLDDLDLRNTKITDAGVTSLLRLRKLQGLDLRNTKITDAGLVQLSRLGKLRVVLVEGTQVTRQGADALRNELPNCQVIFPAMPK